MVTLRGIESPGSSPAESRFAKWSRQMQCRSDGGSGGACARHGRVMAATLFLAAGLGGASSGGAAATAARAGSATRPMPVASFAPAFAHAPLALPLVLNGGFCEYRSNHFHAGLDLGTGGQVGRPVLAPASGWVERVRSSGAGYGRSIYLHADDGRLIVFAHLDAYAEPLAGFVAAAQDSSGQYEQDLWPAPGRFRVAAGQRIAWSGESGSGGPHLHVEVRRGDIAYHPLRSGMAIADTSAPTLASVTLEPLDDESYVERSAAPVTVRLRPLSSRTSPDTVRVLGRVRAVVAARDGVWRGVDRMVPWSVALAFDRIQVECRFDSVSWATDMAESDHIYDSGRVVGERGMVMWAPGGFRPRVMRSNVPHGEDAGTLVVRPGDPPRTLRLTARDLGGHVTEREVVLAPPSPGAGGPDTSAVSGKAVRDSTRWFDVALLPHGHLRLTFRGAPAGSRGVTIGGKRASMHDGAWSAVTRLTPGSGPGTASYRVSGVDAAGRPWSRSFETSYSRDPTRRSRGSEGANGIEWLLPHDGQFEPGPLLYRTSVGTAGAPRELAARSEAFEILPVDLRLRRPMRLEWGGEKAPDPNVGLYMDDGEGWGWVTSPLDSALRRRVGETRHLGRFALFADTLAPRVTLRPVPKRTAWAPYSRWALEARVTEAGSGVDRRASWFEVDGRRMPAEWDEEAGVLRWRPSRRPAAGTHRYAVVVRDRAGNERRASGSFVVRR